MILWARRILAAFLVVAVTLIMTTPSVITFLLAPYSRLADTFLRTWGKILLGIAGVRLQVEGLSLVPQGEHLIFVANHQSYWDIPAMLAVCPRVFRIAAKRELFRIPIFGWILTAARFLPIDRARPKSAQAGLSTAASRVQKGLTVLLFPEGTRSPDGGLLPFKRGPFVISLQSGVRVCPVLIDGTFSVLPRQNPIRFSFGKTVRVKFHEPMSPPPGEHGDGRKYAGAVESLLKQSQTTT